jgi:hypothetical protein
MRLYNCMFVRQDCLLLNQSSHSWIIIISFESDYLLLNHSSHSHMGEWNVLLEHIEFASNRISVCYYLSWISKKHTCSLKIYKRVPFWCILMVLSGLSLLTMLLKALLCPTRGHPEDSRHVSGQKMAQHQQQNQAIPS